LATAPDRAIRGDPQVAGRFSSLQRVVRFPSRTRRQRFSRSRSMTQTLEVHQGVSQLDRAPATAAPRAATTEISRAGIFPVTFGFFFMLLYRVFERLNWPFFTYHPAVGKLDFWMQRPRSGEGPPMYWYGWLVLSGMSAVAVSTIATLLPRPW